MSELWSLPGYDVRSLVGDGRAGDLWSAVERATGEAVALRRVGGGDGADRLRGLVDVHADLPYVVRLREVVEHEGLLVLVLEAPDGTALDALLARRGALEPGEVVTVGVPVAEALAAAHARGVVHGALTAASVLLTPDGMPLLSGLGLEPQDATPQEDVAALAELCAALLPPGLAPRLDAVLAAAGAPSARTSAADLADLLRSACPPTPVRLRPGRAVEAGPGRRHVRRPRRPSRGTAVVAAMVLLVLAGAGAGWWSGRGGEHAELAGRASVAEVATDDASTDDASTDDASTDDASTDDRWSPVLDELLAARATAFAAADEGALADVYAPGAVLADADARLVRSLAAAGRTAEGVHHRVRHVDVVAVDDDSVELRVVDELGPYDVRDADGTVVVRRPGRGEQVQHVVLVRTAAGWRLADVRPA